MDSAEVPIKQELDDSHLWSSNSNKQSTRRVRTSEIQLQTLIECMNADPGIARGHWSTTLTKDEVDRRWGVVARKLNCLNGYSKSVMQWKKVWTDMRSRMKRGQVPERITKFLSEEVKQIVEETDNTKKPDRPKRSTNKPQPVSESADVSEPDLNYVNCSDSSNESQGETFTGWNDEQPIPEQFVQRRATKERSSSPEQKRQCPRRDSAALKIEIDGSRAAKEDPIITRESDMYTELLKRLVELEEMRRTSDSQRTEQFQWCSRQLIELENRRLTLEEERQKHDRKMQEKRMELERRRLRLDRARLATDRALNVTLRKLMEKD